MYSLEHKKYLKNLKHENIFVRCMQLLIIVSFLVIWQLLANLNIINTFIFSSPKNVINTIINLQKTNNLYIHIYTTIYEAIIGFSLGTVLGILFATILWWYRLLAKIIDPYLTILNSLPKVALGPILIIWAGSGVKSIIIMTLFISVIITTINVYQGFNEIDSNKIKLMKSFRATKLQIYSKLIMPGSLLIILSAVKVNVSMSLIGVIMGEFLVSKKGIGYLIMYGSQVFNLNLVITGIIILCVVAAIMYYIVLYIEKRLLN